jgi:hypothetical protein
MVDPSNRVDLEVALRWFPIAVAEVVQVEIPAARCREDKGRAVRSRQGVERLERDRLEWHGPVAAVGLGAFEPAVSVRAAYVEDARLPVDVAMFEREPFARSQAGRRGKHNQRAEARPDPLGERYSWRCLARDRCPRPQRSDPAIDRGHLCLTHAVAPGASAFHPAMSLGAADRLTGWKRYRSGPKKMR